VAFRARVGNEAGAAFLRAEDDEAQRLRHGDGVLGPKARSIPAWGKVAIQGPKSRRYPSLGQRPRNLAKKNFRAPTARSIRAMRSVIR
jgi:hypothetical protein